MKVTTREIKQKKEFEPFEVIIKIEHLYERKTFRQISNIVSEHCKNILQRDYMERINIAIADEIESQGL